MANKIIILHYRKIIDQKSVKPWDKLVFEDSYREYRMQVQNYEQHQQYPAYGELIHYAPQARQLSQQVAPAITGYLQQLDGLMPDILNNVGRRFLRFERFDFEIINSHFEQQERHQIGINFYAAPLRWHDTIGEYLLVSFAGQEGDTNTGINTHLLRLQPYLTIHHLKTE